MITFTFLMILWGIISYIRIHLASKNQLGGWNMMNAKFIDALGFIFGVGFFAVTLFVFCITFLP